MSFFNFYNSEKSSYIGFTSNSNKSQAETIRNSFLEVQTLACTIADISEDMRRSGKADRELLLEFMKSVVSSNERYFGVNVCYEPDAFDGKDALFADDTEVFLNGMVIPYVWKKNGEIFTEWSYSGIDSDNDWYIDLKTNPREYISEPVKYNVGFDENEEEVAVVTGYCSILDDDGSFIGVAAVDVSVDFITTFIEEVSEHNGYAVLLDEENDYFINEELMRSINPDYKPVFETKQLLEFQKSGDSVFKGGDGQAYVVFCTPLVFSEDSEEWYYFNVIPLKTVLADFNNSIRLVVVAVLFALTLAAAVVIIINIRSQRRTIDELTGLNNRAFLNRELPLAMKNSKYKRIPLCVVMCDLDFFKRVNDTYGHVIGDKVLQDFAQVLMKSIRINSDWCARYGGEEFLICLGAELEDTVKVVERMLDKVRSREVAVTTADGTTERIQYTVSCGVKLYDSSVHTTTESFIEGADKNL
jgi:diguanylate cyclase (GGDEF)-like protein